MQNLRVGIIGTGYVGLVTGVCFGELGYQVICGDIIPEKIEKINKGISPIYESGLEILLVKLLEKNLLTATLDIKEVIEQSDVIFICTGTPSTDDGTIDLSYIENASLDIGKALQDVEDFKTIVVKSTVIPGTTSNVVRPLLEKFSNKIANVDFGIGMNPEFLKEGIAIKDFKKPDRIVIGCDDDRSYKMIASLYDSFSCPVLKVNPSTAEMIKYASNTFLATKITFINEIANMTEKMDVDISAVAEGMGLDKRISSKFLRPGLGFGGSCFTKDIKALNANAKVIGNKSNLLDAVLATNSKQPLRAVELLENNKSIEGKKIALLGLAFKPGTDDMRDAPSIPIAEELIFRGAKVIAYDPIAKETAQNDMPSEVIFASSAKEALKGVDAAILVTEWDEFRGLGPSDFSLMTGKEIIDGRRILDWQLLSNAGYNISVLGNSSKKWS